MAELQLEDGELVLHLSGWEKAEIVHDDLRMPLSALRGVEVIDRARFWGGNGPGYKINMPGNGEKIFEKIFVAVHANTPRGVRVHFEGAPWDEWIVGCADPEAVAATLASAS